MSHYKYLGVTLDSQLNYDKHVQNIVSNVTVKLKQFRCMRYLLNIKSAMLVYKNMILPMIEYGDVFLVGTTVKNKKKLQILKNKDLRCALGMDKYASKLEIHKEAKLLQLQYRREILLLCHMYDVSQIGNRLRKRREEGARTHSQNKKLLKIRKPTTEKFKKSVAYRGPKKWNALPKELHFVDTRCQFTQRIKLHIEEKLVKGNLEQGGGV